MEFIMLVKIQISYWLTNMYGKGFCEYELFNCDRAYFEPSQVEVLIPFDLIMKLDLLIICYIKSNTLYMSI